MKLERIGNAMAKLPCISLILGPMPATVANQQAMPNNLHL
ncbi:hypothetical protein EV13_0031 [Prochlorococcus sp. MIT 0702]|nr:hypothetical protein EV12_0731 [Prochlorococcus sp. MIT 0701]KGG31059.1 hypothetical protein EV13_0031 [Prochlorococcus sp. MIT 0702]